MGQKDDALHAKIRSFVQLMAEEASFAAGLQALKTPEIDTLPVFVYAYDTLCGWTWRLTMKRDAFYEFSLFSHEHPDWAPVIRNECASFLARAATQRSQRMQSFDVPPEDALPQDWQEQLAIRLALYAGSTRTWELADRFLRGGHFVVLHYRQAGQSDTTLRPFSALPTEAAFAPEDFQDVLRFVMTTDRQKHPEWFGEPPPAAHEKPRKL